MSSQDGGPNDSKEDRGLSKNKVGGQITLFTKSDCPFCVKLQAAVDKCAKKVLEKHPEGRLEWKYVDCQGANASLCVRLTGSFSVPHVFFNDEYIGDCTSTCAQSTNPSEEDNPIITKLTQIALGPKMDKPFPPLSDTTIVKITEDLACSGQPSDDQLAKINSSFGFASVINLTSPVEASFSPSEETVLTKRGIVYKSLPLLSMTVSSIRNAMAQVDSAAKPTLVHCDTGKRAAVLALLIATKDEPNITEQDFIHWGKELEMDLAPFAPVAVNVAKDVLDSTVCEMMSGSKRAKKALEEDDGCDRCC